MIKKLQQNERKLFRIRFSKKNKLPRRLKWVFSGTTIYFINRFF